MSGEEHTRAAASTAAVAASASPSGGASNGDATKHDTAAPQSQKHATPPAQAERAEEPKQTRAPKLAPAPVPQQTPWKAPPIDASVKAPIDAVEAAHQKRSEQRDAGKPREGKRATTGKEKWVPYTPAPAPPSSSSGSTSSSSSQRGKPARRGANAPYRGQRRSERGDKRQPRSQSGSPAPQAAAAQKHHARSQSTAAPGADEASKLEKLSLEDPQRRSASSQSYRGPAQSNSQGSSASNSPANSTASSSANTPAPQHRKRENPRKMPYYQPGFVPMGYPMQMMRMPVPAVAPGVAPGMADPASYMFNALVAQVDYYFSVENLCKDMYLRKQMNDQGLVPVSTIGAFNRVKSMAPNTEVVAEACRWAPNIELVGSKVRVAHGWQQWVMPQSERLAAGLDNTPEQVEEAPKFQVEQAKPFVPKSQ